MLTIKTPAKINLVLEVLGKHSNGYHEIKSIVQTVDLCDVLYLEKAEQISLECDVMELSGPDNLVFKAASLIKEFSGCQGGCRIVLNKNIPLAAGLGGGSSDAAATLKGLNDLWNLKIKRADLVKLAASLGSDVPLFLYGGSLVIEGRGEKVTSIAPVKNFWAIILVPDLPLMSDKTKSLYARINAAGFSDGSRVLAFLDALKRNSAVNTDYLFNSFDNVALSVFRGLETYWQTFQEAGADNVHVAGSGPALFSLFKELSEAEGCLRRVKKEKYAAYLVRSISAL